MTLEQLRSLVQANTGRTDKDDLVDSALAMAARRVEREADFTDAIRSVTLPLTEGANSVDLPEDAVNILKVQVARDSRRQSLTIRTAEYVYERSSPDRQGIPEIGYITGGKVYFYPSASAGLSFVVDYTVSLLGPGGSTVPLLDEALVCFATSWVLRSLQQHQDAAIWFAAYNEALRTAIINDRRTPPARVFVGATEPTRELEDGTRWNW